MLRRALFGLYPALLVALVFLCGTPGTSVGGPQAEASSQNARIGSVAVAYRDLNADVPDGAISQFADDDNHDTPIDRVLVTVIWPAPAFNSRILPQSDRAGPTHRPCAAEPRAPPTA